MDRIERRLRGAALARYRGGVATKGRPLLEAIALDLARTGLAPERIVEALHDRCRVLHIRYLGDYPSDDSLRAIVDVVTRPPPPETDLLRLEQRAARRQLLAAHADRMEQVAYARAIGVDPREIGSQRDDR